ncbi:hypothetical protein ACLIA0_00325 [Bacillaceae bacterium W0354]
MSEQIKEQSTIVNNDSIDIIQLPPRSTKHQGKRKKRNHLFKYKLMIHLILFIFIILILAIPFYYYMFLK